MSFEIIVDKSGDWDDYTYRDNADRSCKYIRIYTTGTHWLQSLVTFKPANIPDAPVMVVNTRGKRNIYLPSSVDDWEIEYYSKAGFSISPNPKYLKNVGYINLNEYFKPEISMGWMLNLVLSTDQYLQGCYNRRWYIMDWN